MKQLKWFIVCWPHEEVLSALDYLIISFSTFYEVHSVIIPILQTKKLRCCYRLQMSPVKKWQNQDLNLGFWDLGLCVILLGEEVGGPGPPWKLIHYTRKNDSFLFFFSLFMIFFYDSFHYLWIHRPGFILLPSHLHCIVTSSECYLPPVTRWSSLRTHLIHLYTQNKF